MRTPPILGATAREIWDAWRALPAPGGTYTIDGAVIAGGRYFWRNAVLYRAYDRTARCPAWFREATTAELDDVWDAIEGGCIQITAHAPAGVTQSWTHDVPSHIYHQATGRALTGTAAEARMRAISLSRPAPSGFTRDADGNLVPSAEVSV